MNISIIGANGMLSTALTKYYYGRPDTKVVVYGLDAPHGYVCDEFYETNLIKLSLDYTQLLDSNVIIYASGAGVQAALKTDPALMYALNVTVPIDITLGLKKNGYKGIYVSFGSYMEIGANNVERKAFSEEEVVCSPLPVTNDYALSKRLYGRYMRDFKADYTTYHFILPNIISEDDLKSGTRLVPYTLKYLQDYTAGRPMEEPHFSEGIQKRQFISLEEMIQAVDMAIKNIIPAGIYNVGGGEYLSIRSLIERLFALFNVPCEKKYFEKTKRRDSDILSLCLDGSKLFDLINYLPDKTIEDLFKRDSNSNYSL